MKTDLRTPADLLLLIDRFYSKAKTDSIIGFFFTDVISVNWEVHLSRMAAFWENVLFHTGDFDGNPLQTHARINLRQRTEPYHFERWQLLFNQTVDELFEGTNAQRIKEHAAGIAGIMQSKLSR